MKYLKKNLNINVCNVQIIWEKYAVIEVSSESK